MKKFRTKEYEEDCRITGEFNNCTLAIARAVTKELLPQEKMHSHLNTTEYYIFLRGKAEMLVNNDIIKVAQGDVLMIEPGEMHKVNKIIEEIDYIAIRDSITKDKKLNDKQS
ncbi:MAG: cupin domain-containing protein [Patescibacteria group bacterium]